MINSLAELKRALTMGASVETLTMLSGAVVPESHPFRVRQVTKVQTQAVRLGESWLDFDKASSWNFEGDTFKHSDGRTYRLIGA
jgi:hypothetical protein